MLDTTVPLTPAQGAQWEIATKAILCDCGCHPQSVKDCACGRAAELRDQMAEMVVKGQTGTQVIAQFVREKGEKILVSPKAEGFNLLAWIGPVAALLLAAVAMAVVLRRWKGRVGPLPAPADAPADDAYTRRLENDLKEYDR